MTDAEYNNRGFSTPRRDAGGVVHSDALMAGKNEIQILHEGELYRLRITKNGKLILNK